MADLKAFAEELVSLTQEEVRMMSQVLKDEYDICAAQNYSVVRPHRVSPPHQSKHQCNRIRGTRKYKKHKKH